MTEKEICKMVELQLGKRGVQPTDRLLEDLGAESADVANLVARAEERYGVFIKESEIARIFTPADLFAIVQQKQNEA
mgnify:FL=1